MGSKRVGLARTKALLENLKREINLSGSTLTNANVTAKAQELSGDGLQSGSVASPKTTIQEFGNEIITTYQIDLTGLSGSKDAGVAIGNAEGAADGNAYAYMLQWDQGKNGICHKIELACIEAPINGKNTGNATFRLSSSTVGTFEHNQAPVDDPTAVVYFGNTPISASMTIVKDQIVNSPGDQEYLYLCTGLANTGNASGSYTQGKLVFKFHSYKDF